MSKEILPCPHCGSENVYIRGRCNAQVTCRNCGMEGPEFCGPSEIIAAWNSLPRSLHWTQGPPKTTGKYWWRPVGMKIGIILEIYSRSGKLGYLNRNDFFITDIAVGEWAGPIVPPVD